MKPNVGRDEREPAGYPIAPDVQTTRERTVVPIPIPSSAEKIFPCELAKYERNGYGQWHYGPGLAAEKRLDLMPSTYSASAATSVARLLRFFVITDIHVTDKESPAQLVVFGFKGGSPEVYSGVMLYTPHVLDAPSRRSTPSIRETRSTSASPWATPATTPSTTS